MPTLLSARRWLWLLLALAVAFPHIVEAAAPVRNQPKNALVEPARLVIHPAAVRLTGPQAMQQLIVTGQDDNGRQRDLTSESRFSVDDAQLLSITPGGFIEPRKNGSSQLVVRVGSKVARVPVVVEGLDERRPISFRHDFIAALNVAGCNQGACHGIPSGRGGFRLSLRGYDPSADYVELTHGALGRRVDRFEATSSLIYKKGLARVPHQGGKRFEPDSVAGRTILSWLRQGMPDDPATLPKLERIDIAPGARVLYAPANRQQLAVSARYSDGSVRDVTRLTVFTSNDDSLAQVDANGLVEVRRTGEAVILCRYLDVIECVRLTYLEPREDFRWSSPPENNYVDRHTFAKLKTLNILPSELCTDQEFLRRVYLDLCGILPTPEEVQAFLSDQATNKRAALVDKLLTRPEFADLWAYHWLDVLRCNRMNLQIKGSLVYHQWLRHNIETNTPWSQVVRELLTASGSTFANPAANYFRGTYSSKAPPSVRDPQDLAETTAQLFFGIRMQCARCHNHPYERWTQDDYYHLTAWFPQVKAKVDHQRPGSTLARYVWQLREDAIVIYAAREGEMPHPRTGEPTTPKIMGMPAPTIPPGEDRREALADQVTSPDNPFFAKATVNRIWYQLLGKGIVDPPDDFRDSNPPANDELLDALAKDFVVHGFDVKHLIRTIANSRTYQLSAHGNASNRDDEKYFSHALVNKKRLSAEVLMDAICAATGLPEKFTDFPLGTRAVQLPDTQVVYTGGNYASWERHAFLKAFGQPAREVACQCEREGDVSLSRVLELKNGSFVREKLRAKDNRIGKLLASGKTDRQILDELFLASLSRLPNEQEAQASLTLVGKTADKRAAWESVQWAVLNANEFFLRY